MCTLLPGPCIFWDDRVIPELLPVSLVLRKLHTEKGS